MQAQGAQQYTTRGKLAHGAGFIVYARHEHGSVPVRVVLGFGGTRYEVSGSVFGSVRGLMRHLYGRDVPGMTFERYFRVGEYAPRFAEDLWGMSLGGTVVDGDIHQELRETQIVRDDGVDGFWEDYLGGVNAVQERDFREGFGARLEGHIESLMGDGEALDKLSEWIDREVGIRLGERSTRSGTRYKADEVRKLLFAGFMGKMMSKGYDPEEVLQEVYKGLLVRNRGKCPFEEGKGSFGHYVHMVISCILTNYHRKQSRRMDRDSVPLCEETDIGQWGSCEIGYGTELRERVLQGDLERYLEGWEDPQVSGARKILPYVLSGCRRGEIVEELGMNEQAVSRAMACLRRAVASWAQESGLGWGVPEKFLVA